MVTGRPSRTQQAQVEQGEISQGRVHVIVCVGHVRLVQVAVGPARQDFVLQHKVVQGEIVWFEASQNGMEQHATRKI